MKKWLKRLSYLIALLLVGALVGSFHEPAYNSAAVETIDSSVETPGVDDDTFVWVALSGGGTRAAAMAWETLQELRRIPLDVVRGDRTFESNLADEIDYISGISGGSFAAVAWALYKDEPDTFRRLFLERNIERKLVYELARPVWRPFTLASPRYNRINVAAEFYDREIFNGVTFAELPSRPALRIHATDLALGSRFTFSEDDFEKIGSDLSTYPVAYACAASSAFPVLLSPLTLKNYGETMGLEDLYETDRVYRRLTRNSRQDVLADLKRLAREHYNDKSNGFVHLADGGIVDNQGLGALLDEFDTTGVISRRIANSALPLRRLILINVNAGVTPGNSLSKTYRSPGVSAVVGHTMVASMDILSARRWMRIKDFIGELYKPVINEDDVAGLRELERPYTVEISFRNLKDAELKEKCNSLPTSFALNSEQLALIARAVPELLHEDPDLQRLKESVSAGRQ